MKVEQVNQDKLKGKAVNSGSAADTTKGDGRHLAVILVRGKVGVRSDAKSTFEMLKLKRKHNCVVIPDNSTNRGMLNKVRNYVAYGIVDAETLNLLESKRGKKSAGADSSQKVFALHPPRGGFEKGGIKKSFSAGGVLGDRKGKINDLIKKML